MSKSQKKQRERARAQASEGGAAAPVAPAPSLVDEALYERVRAAVRAAGEQDEAGAWLYNGDTVSIKLVEGDGDTPRRVLVAAFQQGVVFQVEGERQVVRRPGEWLESLPTGPAT
jgi:hypothetical protein